MGLTVHFKLTASAGCTEAQAKQLVESMRRTVGRYYVEGRVDRVLPITSDAKTLRRYACDWLILRVPGSDNTSTGVEVFPLSGSLFGVIVGDDCEPFFLGLCQYPLTVLVQGVEVRTKLGTGWRLSGFSKTQYASLHGWEHFQRCHCVVVDLLAGCRALGLKVKISDEGDYWPTRSLKNLRRNLDQMNGVVAAAAGAMKDYYGAREGEPPVQSPIFAHRQFERLEAQGAERVAPVLKRLRAAIDER